MIRDNGPIFQMGFGSTSHDLSYDDAETRGPNPDSGVISKALHQHPVMRFFATAAATMVGMHVGGKLVREGGMRLGMMAQESNKQWVTNSVREIRKINEYMDQLQGVSREFADGADYSTSTKLFRREGNKVVGDKLHDKAGFYFTKAEKEAAKLGGYEGPVEWTIKDEIQKNLVRSARRLPYELPTAYFVQRGLTDSVFGTNHEFEGKWHNPVDVMTDFVNQSTRNLATMIGPFEVGGAVVSQSWRRAMTLGDDFTNLSPRQQTMAEHGVILKDILGRVGHDSTELLNKAVKMSSQSTGALAAGIKAATDRSMSVTEMLHDTRNATMSGYKTDNKILKTVLTKLDPDRKIIRPEIFDLAPGPFRGIHTGVKAGQKVWEEIGAGHDAFESLMRLGQKGFDDHLQSLKTGTRSSKRLNENLGDLWERSLTSRLSNSGTSIEELAKSIEFHGRGGVKSAGFVHSKFFLGQTQNEYSKLIDRKLRKEGMSRSSARQFAQMVNIASPQRGAKGTGVDLTHRIKFGDAKINAGTSSDLFDQIYHKVGTSFSADETAIIRNRLSGIIDESDKTFNTKGFQKTLKKKIGKQWGFVEDRIIPHAAASLLNKSKPQWAEFGGRLDDAHVSFLKRKTAQATGLKITNAKGGAIQEAAIDKHLRRMHFDPDHDLAAMRGFLTTKGAIGKPWHKEGFNLFGLRQLTVNEAVNKGYFRGSEHNEAQISSLVNKMTAKDPITLGSYSLGGVYTTASGRVVDFNQLKQGFSKFMDKVASETQIPLIHTSPLQLLGYTAKQDLAERSILQYVPGMSNQPFLGRPYGVDDFSIGVRQGRRGSKSKVFSFGIDSTGVLKADELAGLYRPVAAKAGNIVSRHVRIASGNSGIAPARPSEIDKNSWAYKILGPKGYERARKTRKALAVSDDQPDSIFRLAGRLKRRKTDINNSPVMAALLRDGESGTKKNRLTLTDSGEVLDHTGKIAFGQKEVADAFDKFVGKIRNRGFSRKTIDHIASDDKVSSRLRGIFKYDLNGASPKSILSKNGAIDLGDIKGTGQALDIVDFIARNDAKLLTGLGSDQAVALRRAQNSLLWRHLNESSSSRYWDRGLPGNSGSNALHTRLDVLQTDLLKYMIIRKGITSQTEYVGVISEMMQEFTKLKSMGRISQAELTEARSALLSTQISVQGYLGFEGISSSLANTQKAMGGVRDSLTSKSALTDIIEGRSINNSGLSRATRRLRKRLGTAEYDSPEGSFNPFGQTNTVFMPTFGTAFNNRGSAAVTSALGWNTWRDPQAFSGSAIPMAHMVERLNKYSGIFGATLDTSQFNGPLDLYLRGMVARRALPLVAGGATALAVDRTIGGYTQPKDENGDRVYSPFFLGAAGRVAAEMQVAASVLPGGKTYEEKREEIFEGEVAIRAGRWWPLGNTPFKGGRIQYYRPSWYRRLKSGYMNTDQANGSPLEQLAFNYDFSPLRPFDPYRYERQHYSDRPYPESGDYFTGPWGPLTPVLNATAGRILKPRREMHQEELQAGLAAYQNVGGGGAYMPSGAMPTMHGPARGLHSGTGGGYGGPGGAAGAQNAMYTMAGQEPLRTASKIVARDIAGINNAYSAAAAAGPSGGYGIPAVNGGSVMRPRVIAGEEPTSRSNIQFQLGELGYRTQELFGIYGFASASARDALGLGNKDLTPDRPVLATASAAYGSTRGFWDLNLGGMGDVPLPLEGNYANLEISEIVRRFIPKERTGIETVNPIPNLMGLEHPWLPGSDYYQNFKTGDPYTRVQEGEMRLPGQGYERFNSLHPDGSGSYGLIDQLKILGDVAPWSTEYASVNNLVGSMDLDSSSIDLVDRIRQQVESKAVVNEFSPYKYKYSSPSETLQAPMAHAFGKAGEYLAHRDSFLNTKLLPSRTAVEDWERENVYGSTFPQWEHPIEDFLKPVAYKATQRHPLAATLMTGALGSLFGRTKAMKTVGSVVGGAVGLGASTYGRTYEMFTGDRYIPAERRKQIALEEYMDILTYTKNMNLANQAKSEGDMEMSTRFMQQAKQTMYGADIYNGDLGQIAMAVPKRKREHFRAMLSAPEQERDQILSTAGRLERRIYQAAWGRQVEERPDLDSYFSQHELPGPEWEGWHPNTNMEDVKVKVAQSMGIEMSELGYYPQQIQEANLINASYPNFNAPSTQFNTTAQLRRMLQQKGISGDVIPIRTSYGGNRVQINGGILSGV